MAQENESPTAFDDDGATEALEDEDAMEEDEEAENEEETNEDSLAEDGAPQEEEVYEDAMEEDEDNEDESESPECDDDEYEDVEQEEIEEEYEIANVEDGAAFDSDCDEDSSEDEDSEDVDDIDEVDGDNDSTEGAAADTGVGDLPEYIFTARKGTVEWYIERSHLPLYSGAPMTMRDAVYALMQLKHTSGIKDKAFSTLLSIVKALLPPDNLLPPSLHLCKGIIGVTPLESVEYHVCPNDCCLFENLPKEDWSKHANQKCEKCGSRRFKETTGGSLEPAKVINIHGSAIKENNN